MEDSDRKVGSKHGEKPSSPPPPPPQPSVGFWELFRFADGLDYALIAIGTLGAIGHGSAVPLYMRVMAQLFNSLGANTADLDKMMKEVVKYSFYYLIVGAVVWVSSWAEISCWMWTSERQCTKMRIKYLEAALNQDIQFYDIEIQTSDVIYAINTDAVTVQDAIGEKMGNFVHYIAAFVSGFAVGFSAVWRLALVTLAVAPLMAMIGTCYSVILNKLNSKNQQLISRTANIVEETIVQIRTVFAYVGESRAFQAYSAALKNVQPLAYKCGLAKGIGMGTYFFCLYAGYALLIWYGGIAVRHHFANGALVTATISAITLGGQSMGLAGPIVSEFAKARASAAKIFRLIDHVPGINRDCDSGLELDSVTGQLQLENVDFCYPSRPENRILNNLSLTIPAGKTIALVGSSGSGKSTVVSLIERFYDPTSGQILLDGQDIKTLKLRWLRQQIGLVSQEPALFATTIKENILFGRPGASMVEIEEAAKVANAHSFILKLPDGYDTQVGERGLQLSGGQKQRIAIARAMLRNPSILLLDEATSALDTESEKLVQEALDRFMIARTTLVIAHRLSTIQKADLVAVLEQGSLSEFGRPDERISMGNKSIYAKLIRMQESGRGAGFNNAGKRSARSPGRHSWSSPINAPSPSYIRTPILTADSFYHFSPFTTPNSPAGLSPYTSRLSECSSPDHSFIASAPEIASKKQANAFWRLVKMNSLEWPYALIGSIGSIILGAFAALFCYILGCVLSVYYSPNHSYMITEINKYCYLLIGLSLGTIIFSMLHYSFWEVVGENLTKRVKEKLLAAVLKNEMAWFDREENESAIVAARLALDANRVRSAIGDQISVILQNCALLLVACTAGFLLHWRLTLVLLAVFPFIATAAVLQRMFMEGYSGDLEAAHAKDTQLAGEAIANIRTVAAFNSESEIVGLFTSNLQAPLRRSFWRGQIAGIGFGIAQFFLYASYALALWYASWLVQHGKSDFSKTIRVFMVIMFSAETAAVTLTLIPDFIKGGRAMRSVFEILDYRTQIDSDDPKATEVSGRLQGEVEFKHVVFTYPSRPDVPVLRDLSFHARAGKTLALVGPSGCGKSSIIALIERFYEPSSGRIMIDGKDIRKYNLKSLRRQIALVPQEPCLFATSIYENIAYGNESATEAEIIEAATLANAHKFISSMPDGYKTFAGERGVQLSGGQKQRIALARAFLKKADIMLLDEATSALDSESETGILEALDRVCSGKTTIVVAHRLATIRNADVILVIDDGKVAEQGSDSQLLRNPDGIYARMIHLQSMHGQAVDVASGSSSLHP